MYKKKIMILGASQLQLPAIIKAKEKGLYVIVVDMSKNAVGVRYADEFYEISTIDVESIVKKAEELKIDGIMTLATDMPMRSVAAVGECLGLSTINSETAKVATDKARMRERLSKYNVPSPFFSSVFTYEEFEKIISSFQGDLIIKPADSSGSRGVYLLKGRKELKKAYEYSKNYSYSGEVVVEDYMRGSEVSVETITVNGITHVIAITDKVTSGPPYFVESGHSIQSCLSDEIKKDIEKLAIKAIYALGIDNSPAHTEIIVTNQGAKIVELGARLGGDNITTHLVPLATGVDMVGTCIDLALGNKPDITPKINRGSAIRYINCDKGKIQSIYGIDEIKIISQIKEINLLKTIGDEIVEVRSSSDRIGYVIAQGEDAKDAINICEKALCKISITVK